MGCSRLRAATILINEAARNWLELAAITAASAVLEQPVRDVVIDRPRRK
jgi:hypothetical protein